MGQMRSFKVTGESMVPNILPGEWLIGETTDSVRVGDVIVVDRGGARVVHRFIGWHGGRGWEMGDACAVARSFGADQVVGRIVTVVGPRGRRDLTTRRSLIEARLWVARLLGRLALHRSRRLLHRLAKRTLPRARGVMDELPASPPAPYTAGRPSDIID